LPSFVAIAMTFVLTWWIFRRELRGRSANVDADAPAPAPLAVVLLLAAAGVVVTTSALRGPLGAATFACGAAALCVSAAGSRAGAATIVRGISWRVVALTAALFVVVTALDDAGGFAWSRAVLAWSAQLAAPWSSLATGFVVAAASNVINNLPVGLNLGETIPAMHATMQTSVPALIGVNLGPNATAHGSLATLLWLGIVRRANIAISPLGFARIGALVTIPALAAALLLR
jgi:arsenical pump membrane protein